MHRLLTGLFASLLLAACSQTEETQPPQAMSVEIYTVKSQPIPNVIELPGRIEAVRTAEVRARVTGIVQQRLYQEGTDVRAGQPLFRIDPSELRANYAQSKASLDRARATAANAHAVVERYRPLVAEDAISRQEFDAAVAASREADANVAQIRAQLDASGLQLGYTTVRAPISGRAGRAEVTEGALVSAGSATLMTRVEQTSPVYVSFSQSSSKMLEARRKIEAGELDLQESDRVPIKLLFSDGSEYPIEGYIDFLAFSVDPETGTMEIRAEIPNPNGLLLPGEFVRARIFAGELKNGIAVPQRAVTVGENGGTVFVVDAEGKVAVRPIKLGTMTGEFWIVNEGLTPGDAVIISNLQKLRPGIPVKPIVKAARVPTARAEKVGAN